MSSFELIWGVFIDPEGDGSLVPDEARREVLIRLPGTPHIMSAEIGKSNAPRTAIPIRGDFEAKVRVTGTNDVGGHATTGDFPPYHGGGLIIHRDGANYLRLEIATDIHKGKHRHYSNFEYWRAGDLVFSRGVAAPTGTATLRIVRRGNEITAEFSPDGRRRHVFPILTAPLGEEVEVGLVAINSASKPLELRYSGLLIRPLEPAADIPPPAAPR
ncbi:MAG: DUF1349 domain-containing protein [Isosphaeraceae bacterium]|nr:DUF1349 domain-containing protein [Isosphaeraceae bacterium]